MSFNFSFSETAGASQSTVRPNLGGNEIYTVKFDECVIDDIIPQSDPSIKYRVLRLKFSNEDGVFEHLIWEPRKEDSERGEQESKNGSTFPTPSNVESMMLLLKHAIDAINPTIGMQIDKGERVLGAANWEELRTLVAKILNAGKGVETQIKLLKNKNGEAIFPGFFAGISSEGKVYMRNNFIGKKLAFNSYEMNRIKNASTAVKTDMASVSLEETANDSDLSVDFDDLDDINLL